MASGGRIGVILDSGEFLVKSGINAPWTVLADSGAVDFALNGDRIALLLSDGTLEVKDGENGAWTVLVTGGVRQFALSGDRIGVVLPDRTFEVKDGINGTWVTLATSGVKDIRLRGNLIGMLTDGGELMIKDGTSGTWATGGPYGGDLTQYQLEADVPLPPVRTTPESYAAAQAACHAQLGGVNCITPDEWAPPDPPLYGRFCGIDVPLPSQWDAASRLGPIDGMDVLCRHHDLKNVWYPEATGTDGACIVLYGLHFSRVTEDGVVLADGTSSKKVWNAAWGAAMPRLKNAVDDYFSELGTTCTSSQLDDFITATAGQ